MARWPFPGMVPNGDYVDANGVRWRRAETEAPVPVGHEDDAMARTAQVAPRSDSTYELGSPRMRYAAVRTTTGTMVASDAREKTEPRALTAQELAAAVALSRQVRAYQLREAVANKGTDAARWHLGMTVQVAIAALTDAGADPMRLAFVCHDSGAGWDRYSFRDTQLTEFLVAGLDARLRPLETAAVQPRLARRLITDAAGSATVTLPGAGMVLAITPRTDGAVIRDVVESTTAGVTQAVIRFRRLRVAEITLGGLLRLSLFETNPGAIAFDLVATPPTP